MKLAAHVLLVEDDPEIACVVRDDLRRRGYTVTWSSTGVEGWEDFNRDSYHIVLVDLMLPEMDGFTLCKNIRLVSDVPMLIISAYQEDVHKVRGLDLGADDYVTKPFSLAELNARVESHLRRFYRYQISASHETECTSYAYGLSIDFKKQRIFLEGQEMMLTAKEMALVLLMARHPFTTFSKKELYEHVWQQADADGNNTVTVHVKSLRAKLMDTKREAKFIQTVWGSGYRFIGEQLR